MVACLIIRSHGGVGGPPFRDQHHGVAEDGTGGELGVAGGFRQDAVHQRLFAGKQEAARAYRDHGVEVQEKCKFPIFIIDLSR